MGVSLIQLNRVIVSVPASTSETPHDILDDVSLTVSPGEYIAIIGHNGSGKSTLARLMNGLTLPTSGEVLVAGRTTSSPRNLPEIRAIVGMVFQHPDRQQVATTVEEDIAFGLENLGVHREEMTSRVDEVLHAVGISHLRQRLVHQLSGGQKQRAAIAAVAAMRPKCIIFDEATSMLDGAVRTEVVKLMEDLNRKGVTVITITHDMNEAMRTNRVIVTSEGKIRLDGHPRDVFQEVEQLRRLRLDVPMASDMAVRCTQVGIFLQGSFPLSSEEFARAITNSEVKTRRFVENAREASDGVRGSATPKAPNSPKFPITREAPVILEVAHLSHAYMVKTPYEQQSLRDVSLTVHQGEVVAVIGQTGSGKSSLIQHLNGLYRPSAPQDGRVRVKDVWLNERGADLRKVRRSVGLVMQSPEDQLFEALVGDDVAYGPMKQGLSLIEVRERVRFGLEAVGLDFSFVDRPTSGMSGGEKRKVAIAGVIATKPEVLVLDEPTAGLDPESRHQLFASLHRLRTDLGMAIVLVTHRTEEVLGFADTLYVLRRGEMVAHGRPIDLLANPSERAKWQLTPPESVAFVETMRSHGWPLSLQAVMDRDACWRELSWLSQEGGGAVDV